MSRRAKVRHRDTMMSPRRMEIWFAGNLFRKLRLSIVGHKRRKRLKAGVAKFAKRLLGNARAVLAGVYIAAAALAGAAASAVPSFSRMRPDILEICGQQAQFTSSFPQGGWRSSEPFQLSSDLCDEGSRDAMSRWIQQSAPRLVVMTECCPRVMSSSHKHAKPSQDSRRQRKKEQKVRDMCVFIQQIVDMQIKRGDHMLLEVSTDCDPEAAMMCDSMIKPIKHPSLRHVEMRSGGGQNSSTGAWITTCPFLEKELCNLKDRRERGESPNDRHRQRCELAKAVCKGFTCHLREHDPARLRKMLRSLAAKIRDKVRGRDRRIADTRWTEKNIMKALGRWSAAAVYALDEHDDDDEEMIPDRQDPQQVRTQEAEEANPGQAPSEQVRRPLGEHGITFEVPAGRKLSEAVRKGLVKAHCNLGHPGKEDLIRFLKIGGARQEVLEAVTWVRCVTCAHARRPNTHRTTNIPQCQVTFGDEVQLDCICVHDSQKQSYWFLSIVDRDTSYHAVEILRDHSPEELYRAFDRGWARWAGPPARVTVDMEGGFQGKDFWEQVSRAGSCLTSIAGTAHWQAGKVERHNQIVKDMIFNVVRQIHAVGRDEMRRLTREVSWAKNSLV